MESIIIRGALPEDAGAIGAIEGICFPPAEAASPEVLAKRLIAFKDSFFVAQKDDQVIGFINGRATDSLVIDDALFVEIDPASADQENWCIFGLDVLPDFQRQGIAAQLMNHFIAEAQRHRKKRVLLTCKAELVPYYKKFSFKNDGISDSTHGGAQWFDMTLTF